MAQAHVDRDTFLRYVRRSRLMTGRQIKQIVPQLPDTDRGRSVARAMVEKGLLTRFQAELLLIGRTRGFFLGQYRILDQLGRGGMGRVFKAMHQTMNRVVALKVLAPHLVETERAKQLFKREVRAAAQLSHANIVTAYDANQIGNRHYLVMEYIDGPNLEQLVRDKGALPAGLACEIIRQAALGLQHAHEMGMVHRDIKPANLLLQKITKNNQATFLVKILDFGLAHLHEGEHDAQADSIGARPNTVQGTPDFLSPEQAKASPNLDIRSDLYSLGCTFYYLLTGQVPFPGGTSLEKLIRHNAETPRPIPQSRPDVPADVIHVVNRLMAKDPTARFQTPQELVEALAPLAETAAPWSAAKPPSMPELTLPPTPTEDLQEDPDTEALDPALEGTVPPAMGPTTTSDDALSLPWEDSDHLDRHLLRRTLMWSVAIVAGLASAALWFLLSQN